MWTVYILKSIPKSKYYIGCTNNIDRRISEHNNGQTSSNKAYIPYGLIYTEMYKTQQEAYAREKQIKRYKGGRAFKKLIEK